MTPWQPGLQIKSTDLTHADAEAVSALEFGNISDAYFNASMLAQFADFVEHANSSSEIADAAIVKMMVNTQ